jgi:putative peptidoglycan binding protein
MPDAPLLELEGAPDEQLTWLEGRLDAAADDGVVRPLPAASDQFATGKLPAGQLQVIRDRLFKLGYLKKDTERDSVDKKLKRAIRGFQEEANLEADSWVGVRTWQALQELFAFEPTIDLGNWIENGVMCPALRRAIILRLKTYGLVEDGPTGDPGEEAVAKGLKKWSLTLGKLGDGPAPIEDEPWTRWLLERLFDLDHLISLVVRHGELIRGKLLREDDSGWGSLVRFLKCLVKIDLWLLGYDDIRPDGKGTTIKRTPLKKRRGGPQQYRYTVLYKAIRTFWRDQELPEGHSSKLHVILFRTFSGLHAAHIDDIDDHTERRQRARDVLKKLRKQGGDLEERWRKTSIGGRLWDGVKRAWRFVARLFKGAVDAVKRAVEALYRVAYGAALEAFSLIRRTVRGFVDAVELLWRPEIRGSNEHIAMCHDRDFDFRVFVAADASKEKIDGFFAVLRERLRRLHVTMRGLRMFVTIAITSAKAAALPWGWWSLIRTLVKLHGELREDDIRAIREPLPVPG